MLRLPRLSLWAAFFLLFAAAASAQRAAEEITVSSANYARSSKTELIRALNPSQKDLEEPAPPPSETPATPQRYLFTRGEIAESDVTYEELCKRLEPLLAKKGFVNAVNAQGRVPQPDQLKLILRVSYGPARWRDPVIRLTDLSWKHGLVPSAGTRSAGLTAITVWDSSAGGNDEAVGEAVGGEGDAAGDGDVAAADSSADTALVTDDYYLIVVDAFDYHDLLKNRYHSNRVWTTFISISKPGERKFSEVADAMLARAAPYFGETTMGRVKFVNKRANVKLGDLKVVDDDAKSARPAERKR